MVRHASNCQNFYFQIARDAQQIRREVFLSIRRNHRGALLGAEYAMNNVGCIGMAHLLSPLRGWSSCFQLPSAHSLG